MPLHHHNKCHNVSALKPHAFLDNFSWNLYVLDFFFFFKELNTYQGYLFVSVPPKRIKGGERLE